MRVFFQGIGHLERSSQNDVRNQFAESTMWKVEDVKTSNCRGMSFHRQLVIGDWLFFDLKSQYDFVCLSSNLVTLKCMISP